MRQSVRTDGTPNHYLDSVKKHIKLPVPHYLKKYLFQHYEEREGVLNLPETLFFFMRGNALYCREQIMERLCAPDCTLVMVETKYTGYRVQYSLVQKFKEDFDRDLILTVKGFVAAGHDPIVGIRYFFDIYDISEEEFKEETAFKRWQRSKERRALRERIAVLGDRKLAVYGSN